MVTTAWSRNDIERALSTMWNIILVDPISGDAGVFVGLDDDFVDCGVDSMQLLQLIAHIENDMAIRVPIDVVLENTTISKLAERIFSMIHAPA